ncbi:hypothetical protein BDV95DRAFT_546675 [Massariosphaeria phaeospora]|uniref:gamma-glutamylcyclotransferase n=1 Tax=Massariosphaeria phaeospora TaxID=100035 RepID=A0A7C8ICC2_9PLEO|nr:hypothetical protein BDV95DRAFT_546675 [Massariosphaeria phaeospora]
MDTKENNTIWYFAYGSNMSETVLTGRRKIQPHDSKIARCNEFSLSFNVMGVPYSDPAMGGLRIRDTSSTHDETASEATSLTSMPVHGIAYLLDAAEFRRLVAIEGGGIAYRVIEIQLDILGTNSNVRASTLVGRHDISDSYIRLPSKRYLNLLILGAKEHSLPAPYQNALSTVPTFQPGVSARYKIGKWLFDSFWQRVAQQIERNVGRFKNERGIVPAWFLTVFDLLLWTMWIYHDYFHSAIWGRGDGR